MVIKEEKESIEVVEEEKFSFENFVNKFVYLFNSGIVYEDYQNELKKLKDVPFPVPIVTEFNKTGYLTIRFSKEVLVPVKSELTDFC